MDADPQAYTQITMKKGSFKEPFGGAPCMGALLRVQAPP
jgi:hypothetical protein